MSEEPITVLDKEIDELLSSLTEASEDSVEASEALDLKTDDEIGSELDSLFDF